MLMGYNNLFMGWLSLPSPLPFKIPLKGLEIYKMPCQKQRQQFNISPLSHPRKNEKDPLSKESQRKLPLSDDVRRDLRRRKLFFTCQESWASGHRCAARKAHYIEVFYDDEEPEGGHSVGIAGEDPPALGGGNGAFDPIGGSLASLRGVPKYLTLRVGGSIQDQRCWNKVP